MEQVQLRIPLGKTGADFALQRFQAVLYQDHSLRKAYCALEFKVHPHIRDGNLHHTLILKIPMVFYMVLTPILFGDLGNFFPHKMSIINPAPVPWHVSTGKLEEKSGDQFPGEVAQIAKMLLRGAYTENILIWPEVTYETRSMGDPLPILVRSIGFRLVGSLLSQDIERAEAKIQEAIEAILAQRRQRWVLYHARVGTKGGTEETEKIV